ncbi:MAG: carboxypeptidase-like regulatory domain-containing protein [Candidatus Bathyarchaeia archaeon]
MRKGPILLIIVLWTLVIITILSSCEFSNYPTGGESFLPSPTPLPKPEPGRATVIGRVISLSGQPVLQVPVWLAEVIRQGEEGVYILDSRSSPGVYTDDKGFFVIPNINPGEYVIIVGDPEGLYEIIAEPSGRARVWNIPPDQILNIGELKVSLLGK